MNSGLE